MLVGDGPFLYHVTARKFCEGVEKANGLIFAALCDHQCQLSCTNMLACIL